LAVTSILKRTPPSGDPKLAVTPQATATIIKILFRYLDKLKLSII
jgi:hypothetical protein